MMISKIKFEIQKGFDQFHSNTTCVFLYVKHVLRLLTIIHIILIRSRSHLQKGVIMPF